MFHSQYCPVLGFCGNYRTYPRVVNCTVILDCLYALAACAPGAATIVTGGICSAGL